MTDQFNFAGLFQAALTAAKAEYILPQFLPKPPKGRTVVIGAGKGAAQLAVAFEKLWTGSYSGLVVTRYGFGADTQHITVMEAAHPIPDAAGIKAAKALQDMVADLSADDLVIALICGGGSALLPAPPEGISLDDEVLLTRSLLRSGLPIAEMNSLRAIFSTIKAGRLAVYAAPAQVISLVVSDVAGDRLDLVASAPTIPSDKHIDVALGLLKQGKITLPASMQKFIDQRKWSVPSPKDAPFMHNKHYVIASAKISLEACADYVKKLGYSVEILSDRIEGEAQIVAAEHGAMIRAMHHKGVRKHIVLSGGELTVTHSGLSGQGGPNSEYILALACEIAGLEQVQVFAADSDGIDGVGDHAGAYADGQSCTKMIKAGIDPDQYLHNHNSYQAHAALSNLFMTGATGTNVNDIRAWVFL